MTSHVMRVVVPVCGSHPLVRIQGIPLIQHVLASWSEHSITCVVRADHQSQTSIRHVLAHVNVMSTPTDTRGPVAALVLVTFAPRHDPVLVLRENAIWSGLPEFTARYTAVLICKSARGLTMDDQGRLMSMPEPTEVEWLGVYYTTGGALDNYARGLVDSGTVVVGPIDVPEMVRLTMNSKVAVGVCIDPRGCILDTIPAIEEYKAWRDWFCPVDPTPTTTILLATQPTTTSPLVWLPPTSKLVVIGDEPCACVTCVRVSMVPEMSCTDSYRGAVMTLGPTEPILLGYTHKGAACDLKAYARLVHSADVVVWMDTDHVPIGTVYFARASMFLKAYIDEWISDPNPTMDSIIARAEQQGCRVERYTTFCKFTEAYSDWENVFG